jgi:hypothetical protein
LTGLAFATDTRRDLVFEGRGIGRASFNR